jgi:hypothetical protein
MDDRRKDRLARMHLYPLSKEIARKERLRKQTFRPRPAPKPGDDNYVAPHDFKRS